MILMAMCMLQFKTDKALVQAWYVSQTSWPKIRQSNLGQDRADGAAKYWPAGVGPVLALQHSIQEGWRLKWRTGK